MFLLTLVQKQVNFFKADFSIDLFVLNMNKHLIAFVAFVCGLNLAFPCVHAKCKQ